jgi:microcystin-dependent protein
MDPFIGEIRLVAFNYAPEGWALCDGRELPINHYQALFALLETKYGGDGVRTFALPKLKGADLLSGLNYVIAMEGVWPQHP